MLGVIKPSCSEMLKEEPDYAGLYLAGSYKDGNGRRLWLDMSVFKVRRGGLGIWEFGTGVRELCCARRHLDKVM